MMHSITIVLLSAMSMLLLLANNTHAAVVEVGKVYRDQNCPSNEATDFLIESPWKNGDDRIRSIKPKITVYIYPNADCSKPGYTAAAGKCSNLPNNAYIHCVTTT